MPHRLNLFSSQFSLANKLESWLAGIGLGLLILGVGGGGVFLQTHQNRIYPGIMVNHIPLTDMTTDQALETLRQQLPSPTPSTVTITVDDISVSSTSAELQQHYDYDAAVATAIGYGKTGPLPQRLLTVLSLQLHPYQIDISPTYDHNRVADMVGELKKKTDTNSIIPSAELKTSGSLASLKINPGQLGRTIDADQAVAQVMQHHKLESISLTVDVASTGAQLTTDQVAAAQATAAKLVKKQVVFKHPDLTLTLTDQQLISLLEFPEGINESQLNTIVSQWQTQVTREPQTAVFEYDPNTLAVKKFVPPRNGLQLDVDSTREAIKNVVPQLLADQAPSSLDQDLKLAVKAPGSPLGDTNNLGIKEQIGFGESLFYHSIPGRVHNVQLTASRINNTLVKPGEEFSFNKTLGDVSAETGFQPAYVIKDGQTVLGDGGGVCQVSSTLFRALLNSGLKVTKRLPHSYRVSYYELNQKPGFDATVYAGNVDLRFVNDTDHYVLIHTETDVKNLYMKVELYGTSDGRTTQIANYKSYDPRPAPEPVYTVDPTLPPGTKKQVDFAAAGIKTTFTNIVKDKNGAIMHEDTYNSNYIPWSAKYLVGPQ